MVPICCVTEVVAMVSWMFVSTLALAGTDPPIPIAPGQYYGDVRDVWHHYERKRYAEAVQLAIEILNEDSANLEAHRVYLTALQRKDWNGPRRVEPIYSTWHADNPDEPVARFAYAAALHATSRGKDCDDGLPLLEPLPETPENRYSALRISQMWMASCDKERTADIEAAFSTEDKTVPAAWSYAIWLQAKAGDWESVAQAIPELIKRYPSRLRSITRSAKASEDPAAKPVLDAIVAWAVDWKDETDPIRLTAMAEILSIVGKSDTAIRAHLDEIDPPGEMDDQKMSKVTSRIYEANKKPTHELALEALNKLEKKMPASGKERALWNYLRSERVAALDRPDEAFAIVADMARSQPDDADTVNDWAYEASLREQDIDEAIAAMERALPSLDDQGLNLAWGDYESWMLDAQSSRAASEDTYGWLLYQAGRHEEAAEVLVKASQSIRDATISAHAGLALLEIGEDDRAWPYLVDANTQEGGTGEERLDRDMRAALERLWPERAEWHPEGLDGWLSARRTAEKTEPADEDISSAEEHELIGQDFPYDHADRLGGGSVDLTSSDVLVVDLWATWCGPCVQGMPHLQEVAEEYADRGVRVVGLSVDENPSAVKKFYKGIDLDVVAYELGHVGRSGFDTMKVSGIPALFVVDREGKIVTYISGYGGVDDDRLERALDDLLGS